MKRVELASSRHHRSFPPWEQKYKHLIPKRIVSQVHETRRVLCPRSNGGMLREAAQVNTYRSES